VQHTAYFFCIRYQCRGFFGRYDFDALRQFYLRLQLVARAVRKSQMVNVLGCVVSSEPFCDIRWYRHARLPDFMSEDYLIVAFEPPRHAIAPLGESDRLLPHK